MDAFLAVLNPGGRDRRRDFALRAGSPSDPGHPPVNYHAYAACCGGGFLQHAREVPEQARAVLLLLRKNGLAEALRAAKELKGRGKVVLISWKESGLHQVAEALADVRRWEAFRRLCGGADGFVSSTPDLVPLYRDGGCEQGAFIPTPYPLGESGWDFSQPFEERRGIFVGTREFFVPSRNHFLAVSTACQLGQPVTVINADGAKGLRLLQAISRDINIVNGRLPYPAYLQLMARHRLVLQLDRSAVPGQVAGDALLCGLPCVGGDGAVERLAFASLNGQGRDVAQVIATAADLLNDEDRYQREIAASRTAAAQMLSFPVAEKQLRELVTLPR